MKHFSLYPFAQSRINSMLEDADEERAAGDNRWADRLIEKARKEAEALRCLLEEAA